MRKLILFLSRNQSFFLFIILEFFCLYLLMDRNHYQRVQYFHTANSISAGMHDSFSGISNFMNLNEQNDSLAAENAKLLELLYGGKMLVTYYNDSIVDTIARESYHYISSRVVKKSTIAVRNYMTIDKGSSDGILPEMGVIGPNGIVGIVKKVSPQFAVIMTVIHSDFKSSCKIGNNIGSLSWDGLDARYASITDFPKHIEVGIGDSVLTSGYSSFFPTNAPIGIVRDIEKVDGVNFYNISVELATNFASLSHVYVIDYLNREERIELEQSIEE